MKPIDLRPDGRITYADSGKGHGLPLWTLTDEDGRKVCVWQEQMPVLVIDLLRAIRADFPDKARELAADLAREAGLRVLTAERGGWSTECAFHGDRWMNGEVTITHAGRAGRRGHATEPTS